MGLKSFGFRVYVSRLRGVKKYVAAGSPHVGFTLEASLVDDSSFHIGWVKV